MREWIIRVVSREGVMAEQTCATLAMARLTYQRMKPMVDAEPRWKFECLVRVTREERLSEEVFQ